MNLHEQSIYIYTLLNHYQFRCREVNYRDALGTEIYDQIFSLSGSMGRRANTSQDASQIEYRGIPQVEMR